MTDGDGKLESLRRATEVGEYEAVRYLRQVQDVVDAREVRVHELQESLGQLRRRVAMLKGEGTRQALQQGGGAASEHTFAKRLAGDIAVLERELDERIRELRAAELRLRAAEDDVTSARIERKKIEKLIANRQDIARRAGEAREELASDERAGLKKRDL
ncbi:MAG: hypothetical protein KDD44_00405 [Bdellovibrionales bacterium]|nr:hypothetical protein [Bdellovibrionales bacterium]